MENVLNHSPLNVYDDASESEPLTPAHFLLAGHKVENPFNFNEVLNTSITKNSLIKRKAYPTKLLSQIWKKWKSEYLLATESFHYFGDPKVQRDLNVNHIVLIEGARKSKFLWNLGQIIEINKGRDGLVRACVVKAKNGRFPPVKLIYPFQIAD